MSFGMIMLKSKFGEKAEFCYMDTDISMYCSLWIR